MRNIIRLLQIILLFAATSAYAQDALPPLPPVPTGLSPLLTYALSVLSVVMTITLPIAVALLKQRLNVANVADRSEIADRAIKRGALISYGNQLAGATPEQAVADGLAYIKNGIPETLGKIDQASDEHLTNAIQAEVVNLNQTGMPVPSAGQLPAGVVSLPGKNPTLSTLISVKGP